MSLTYQEIFNKVWERFVVNKAKPAMVFDETAGSEICVYRGGRKADSDLQCAVGCLIPDELYDPAMECSTPLSLIIRYPRLGALLGSDKGVYLRDLQMCHDCAADPTMRLESVTFHADIERRLIHFAKQNSLLTPNENPVVS